VLDGLPAAPVLTTIHLDQVHRIKNPARATERDAFLGMLGRTHPSPSTDLTPVSDGTGWITNPVRKTAGFALHLTGAGHARGATPSPSADYWQCSDGLRPGGDARAVLEGRVLSWASREDSVVYAPCAVR
jgi:hypothetical protein